MVSDRVCYDGLLQRHVDSILGNETGVRMCANDFATDVCLRHDDDGVNDRTYDVE